MQFSPVVDSVDARKWATKMQPPTKVASGQKYPMGTGGRWAPLTQLRTRGALASALAGWASAMDGQDMRQLLRANDTTALRKALTPSRQELVQDAWNAHQVLIGALQEAYG